MYIGIAAKIAIVVLLVLALPYVIMFILKGITTLLNDVTKYMVDYVAHLHTIPKDKKVTVWDLLGTVWKARKGGPQI